MIRKNAFNEYTISINVTHEDDETFQDVERIVTLERMELTNSIIVYFMQWFAVSFPRTSYTF